MMETQTCAGLVSALEGRAAFYDVVAALYYKPLAQEQIDRIAEGGLAAFAGAGELMAEGLHDMERALSKRHSGTRQELAVDFTGAFAGTSSWKGRYATPYESVFTSEEGLLFQDSYHEVYRLYRQNSVRKSPGYDFPDDHLVYCFRHFSRSGRALYLPFQIWDKGRVEGGGRRTTSSYIVFATSRAVAALFTFLFKYGIKGE
ncbi:TorD/DmsD family molecular chaperone [Eggerthella lenta]|jgi:putative dimethyl sulfoxide reductase chaperone|uniref:TorD/DmsD family molecular chaperone n=2 Tax=Eggerthella lenta TaxID=84112 RepID=UPI0021627AB4|nr:molecular chaperone TorD family protein [Eggerthella lenta]